MVGVARRGALRRPDMTAQIRRDVAQAVTSESPQRSSTTPPRFPSRIDPPQPDETKIDYKTTLNLPEVSDARGAVG
jgi:hypothetical protein